MITELKIFAIIAFAVLVILYATKEEKPRKRRGENNG